MKSKAIALALSLGLATTVVACTLIMLSWDKTYANLLRQWVDT